MSTPKGNTAGVIEKDSITNLLSGWQSNSACEDFCFTIKKEK
jgi:hypothetical protein